MLESTLQSSYTDVGYYLGYYLTGSTERGIVYVSADYVTKLLSSLGFSDVNRSLDNTCIKNLEYGGGVCCAHNSS